VVEITGMSMQTLAVFNTIINGGAEGLRNFVESQAWTYNGSAGDDTIEAGNMADTVVAHSGNDTVNGYGGGDELRGGSGNDILSGGTGKDVVDGGSGQDSLTGGDGKDTFVFASRYGSDTIVDFVNGIDRIDISDWKAIKDFDDVKADMKRDGEDVVITAGDDSLRITHSVKADIDAHDFLF
jgi:Ca2+-binding RTX toxin-like protein